MGAYDDIINLPHHVSDHHPQMSLRSRAAQFAPFAALTGYASEVKEASRITGEKIELSEEQRALLDEHLRLLEDILPERPEVTITYFLPDPRKDGGAYTTIIGRLEKLNRVERTIILTNGVIIPVEDLLQVESEIWDDFR